MIMSDSSTLRPTLKLNLKPTILESLSGKLPKKTVIIPDKVEAKTLAISKKSDTPNKKASSQETVDKDSAPITPKSITPKKERQNQALDKNTQLKQLPKATSKVITPPPPKLTYDFFEIYHKLHTPFRAIISLKNPVALAIGTRSDIRKEAGISKKCSEQWTAEYLRRSLYYKRAHIAGANRYNLQGEITGIVTQEQYEAGQAIFKKLKRKW